MKFLILNGPNINLLGAREPDVYGKDSYDDLKRTIAEFAEKHGAEVSFFQSNCEGELIDRIQTASGHFDAIVINPAAYTHYSYALYDALRACPVPAVEVHLSNIHARDEFRRRSVTAPACVGQISGLGFYGYLAAMSFFINRHVQN